MQQTQFCVILQLRHKISEMEEISLRDKSWQLRGEVLASARPENSLLAETLDFEYMTRQGINQSLSMHPVTMYFFCSFYILKKD